MYYHILLCLFCLVLSLEVKRVVLLALISRIDLGQVSVHVLFTQVYVLKQALAAFFHLDEAAFKTLPEFVVGGASDITRVPHVVFDELLDLVLPLGFQHHLFN